MLGVPFILFYRLVLRSWLRGVVSRRDGRSSALQSDAAAVPSYLPHVRQLLCAILLVVGLAFVLQALNGACCAFAPWMFDSVRAAQESATAGSSMSEGTSVAVTVASVVSGCVIAPVFEELWFRGAWLVGLARACVPFAIANVVQAVVFGLFHFSAYQAMSAFILGVLLGLLVKRTHSVVPGMVAHALHNLISGLPIVPQALFSLGFYRAADELANIPYGAGLDGYTAGLLFAFGVAGLLLVALAIWRTRPAA